MAQPEGNELKTEPKAINSHLKQMIRATHKFLTDDELFDTAHWASKTEAQAIIQAIEDIEDKPIPRGYKQRFESIATDSTEMANQFRRNPAGNAIKVAKVDPVAFIRGGGLEQKGGLNPLSELAKTTYSRSELSSDELHNLLTATLARGTTLIKERSAGTQRTPLHDIAIETRQQINEQQQANTVNVVRELIDMGMSVTQKDSRGNTPLHYAVSEGQNPGLVKLMVERGANLHEKSGTFDPYSVCKDIPEGKTPLEIVNHRIQSKLVKPLETPQFLRNYQDEFHGGHTQEKDREEHKFNKQNEAKKLLHIKNALSKLTEMRDVVETL